MCNAKEEFLFRTNGKQVICAEIEYVPSNSTIQINLMVGHTDQMLENFLNKLDFNYDEGYGTQYLYGTIWFSDGSWMERYEYDGSESWTYCSVPEVPDYLN